MTNYVFLIRELVCVVLMFMAFGVTLSFESFPVWCVCQLEEVRGVPASSEKAIADASARKEEMEKQKAKEEEKLKEVMESLKEETSGLQQDKEVCLIFTDSFFFFFFGTFLWPSLDFHQLASPLSLSSPLAFSPDQRERVDGAEQGRERDAISYGSGSVRAGHLSQSSQHGSGTAQLCQADT